MAMPWAEVLSYPSVLALWSHRSHLSPLRLGFLICEVEIIMAIWELTLLELSTLRSAGIFLW